MTNSTYRNTFLNTSIDTSLKLTSDILDHQMNGVVVLLPVKNGESEIIDFQYIYANNAATKFLRKPKDQLIGKRMSEAFPELMSSVNLKLYIDVIETGKPFVYEKYFKSDTIDNWFKTKVIKYGEGCIAYFDDITEFKRNEEKFAKLKLQEQQELLFGLFQETPAVIAVLKGPELVYEMVNDRYNEVFGDQAFVGKSIFQVFPHMISNGFGDILKKVYADGVSHSGDEYPVEIAQNNEPHYFNFFYTPYNNAAENERRIFILAFDVTEQVKARKIVEETADSFIALTEAIPHVIWTSGTDGMLDYFNEQWLEYSGEPMEVSVGTGWVKFIHPEDKDYVQQIWKQTLESGEPAQIEFRLLRHDNMYRWFLALTVPVKDNEGNIIKWVGSCTDIDDQKKIHEQINQNAEKFKFLANKVPFLIYKNSPEGDLTFLNEYWTNYTGLTFEKTLELGWETAIHPDDYDFTYKTWKQSIKSEKPYAFEYRMKRFDGEYQWHLVKGEALKDDDGNIIVWVGTSINVEEQKRFTDNLEQEVKDRTHELMLANIELKQSNDELEQFAYTASHDLQEPLRKITTFGDRLKNKYAEKLDDVGLDYLNRMRSGAFRMQRMIDDLLTFSRVTRANLDFEKEDLNALLKSTIADIEMAIEEKHARITAADLPSAEVVPSQIRQVFQNLLSNSLKFTEADTSPVINIESQIDLGKNLLKSLPFPDKKYVRISISDNGIGFNPEYAEKIFTLFQRLHGRSEYDGTGIGLAIVKRILENHNGSIEAESAKGAGATFKLYLPLEQG